MISVRVLSCRDDFAGLVPLQRLIWGWDDIDILPVRFFVVAHDIGGQVLGAFENKLLCGFCVSIPATGADAPLYLHSHMLGVLPEYRDAGVGFMLKSAQRTDSIKRGIRRIEWTFDPLDLKNAYFNIEKLGAVIRRYLPNHYGITSSRLQGGLPTDRCLAEWYLIEPRQQWPTVSRVSVPQSLDQLRGGNLNGVLGIQQQVAREFEENFAKGLVVTGFERSQDFGTYLFSTWPSA